MSATAAPMKPKNGAEGGQSGLSTAMMLSRACGRTVCRQQEWGATAGVPAPQPGGALTFSMSEGELRGVPCLSRRGHELLFPQE